MEQGLTNTFTKIIYFDEGTAQDYLDITHGGPAGEGESRLF
ncbi:MAG: hypothetical protein SPL71_07005 [Oribacterium sp.]|nr:hypothetical protein [Oribacterium sp.]